MGPSLDSLHQITPSITDYEISATAIWKMEQIFPRHLTGKDDRLPASCQPRARKHPRCSITGCIRQYTPAQHAQAAKWIYYLTIFRWHPTHKVSSSVQFLRSRSHITFGIWARWQAMRTLLDLYSFATRIPLQTENQSYTRVGTARISFNTLVTTTLLILRRIAEVSSRYYSLWYLARVETCHRCCCSSRTIIVRNVSARLSENRRDCRACFYACEAVLYALHSSLKCDTKNTGKSRVYNHIPIS